jgi:hypothetical protein
MHAFGHTGYVYILSKKRVKGEKFEPRALPGHLVGIVGELIYKMWILDADSFITTALVKFNKYGAAPLVPLLSPLSSPRIAPFAPVLRQLA